MSEKQLQDAIVARARLMGYKAMHVARGQVKGRWVSPYSYDGKGWPDLTLARPGRFVLIEVKDTGEKLTAEQAEWVRLLTDAGCEVFVVWPKDLDNGRLDAILRGEEAKAA